MYTAMKQLIKIYPIHFELETMRANIIVATLLMLTSVPVGIGSIMPIEKINQQENRKQEDEWVAEKFNSMSEDERIGQLINIRAHSDKDGSHEAEVENLIKEYHVGGMTFFQGTVSKQVELTERYQKLARKVPLMVSIDGEWGLGMRLKNTTISYPRQLTLGAIQDNKLIYKMGKEIGRQCQRVGIHVNFAPVVDVNNNANNPVINDRSFGEDRHNVAAKSYMYMKGMQDGGVLACAKHFPGHGDTDVDSHNDLPVIYHNSERLDSVELFPFKVLAQHNVGSMMIAHLSIPSLDNTYNQPSSLSRKIVTDLLQEELGFEGLVFTDGLEMGGVNKFYEEGQLEVKALQAGNDILLLPPKVSTAVSAIKTALNDGTLNRDEFDAKVKKVLRAKYRLGLNARSIISTDNLYEDLNNAEANAIKKELYENALTAVRNKGNILPLPRVDEQKLATLSIGEQSTTTFQRELGTYSNGISHFHSGYDINSTSLINSLKDYNNVIVSFHAMSKSAKKNYGISSDISNFLSELRTHTNVIVVVFGSPYSLKNFDFIDCLIAAYEENDMVEAVAAKAIFGGSMITGRLPVTASYQAKFGDGVDVGSTQKLQYAEPSVVGLDAKTLESIEQIAMEGINAGATPGITVLVAKNNRVVYHKSFGYHTYDKQVKAQPDDIYDMASVTKICATTISVMKLYDEGKIDLEDKLEEHIPALKGTNKADLSIQDVMAHRAGLKAWIPFYKETVIGSKYPTYKPDIYSKTPSDQYSLQITESLYMNKDYANTVKQAIYNSPLNSSKAYVYSDLGFYLMRDLVESVSGLPFDEYVQKTFYEPLGLETAGFNPAKRFGVSRIPPTEKDDYFRNQTIQGYVHDMGAGMLNGVSGHAGLFATPMDIAIIMQMLLNEGVYDGKQYFKPSTVKLFTTRHPKDMRRGIGFDMKPLTEKKITNISSMASSQAFGHLGFTGIMTWADPKEDIVYVFCSNRTYPSMDNPKLTNMKIRQRIQSKIYEAIK
jgi:beta-N-acetylhexosaminidase